MSVVSVIIVNWNGKHLLLECLESLCMQTRPADEIIVVDNGSSDGSQAMIRERFRDMILIELADNKGFSTANNIGIGRAKGDYIALLNNDVVLDQEWMAHMVAALNADSSLGSCACKMLFYDRRDTINAAGDIFTTNGIGASRGMLEIDAEPFQSPAVVFGACAGAAMYRATMFHDIGVFDEEFYMYCEDVDLSFRAQLAGYNCLYVPKAVAYHHFGGSSIGSGKKDYYLARNTLLVVVKNMPAALLRRYLFHILAGQLPYALQAGMRGRVDVYTRSCLDALRMLPHMLLKRRAIHRAARLSDDAIEARLTNVSNLPSLH